MVKNANYSLRAFARDLKVSPSTLSLVMSRKKGMSRLMAASIAERLGLNLHESQLFMLSAEAGHARSRQRRSDAQAALETLRNDKLYELSAETFAQINTWHHFALLELMEVEGSENTPAWFAQRLGLQEMLIRQALERLIAAGLVEEKGSRYFAIVEKSLTTQDVSSAAIKEYHAEVLRRAADSVFLDPLDEREFQSMTVSFNTGDLPAAKQAIRDFQRQFAERFYCKRKRKDSVYQLSVQLFRLDKRGKE